MIYIIKTKKELIEKDLPYASLTAGIFSIEGKMFGRESYQCILINGRTNQTWISQWCDGEIG